MCSKCSSRQRTRSILATLISVCDEGILYGPEVDERSPHGGRHTPAATTVVSADELTTRDARTAGEAALRRCGRRSGRPGDDRWARARRRPAPATAPTRRATPPVARAGRRR